MQSKARALLISTLSVAFIASFAIADAQTRKASTKPAASKPTRPAKKHPDNPVVEMKTSRGSIFLELYKKEAPATVENFRQYVKDEFYDGTIFHRVIEGFMIQGGGFTPDMTRKQTRDNIKNEATNGLSNERGTIAMARLPQAHTASSQFFINVKNNKGLDHRGTADGRAWGYCVFGRVLQGMDVVDVIKGVKTKAAGGMRDIPVDPIVIESVRELEDW